MSLNKVFKGSYETFNNDIRRIIYRFTLFFITHCELLAAVGSVKMI